MKFLIDAKMPRSTSALLARFGHEAYDVRDVLPGGAEDRAVADLAQRNQLALITRDFDFANIRNYPPGNFFGIIVLELPDEAVVPTILRVLESFVSSSTLLSKLPGRLAIVDSARVRLRPA